MLQLCSLVIPELILLNLEKKQEISIERLYFNLGEQMRLVGRKYIVLSYAALSTVLLSSKCWKMVTSCESKRAKHFYEMGSVYLG